MNSAIDEARRLGYRRIVLDTLPDMVAAAALYERFHFTPVEPYYHTPIAGTRFLGLDLVVESPWPVPVSE